MAKQQTVYKVTYEKLTKSKSVLSFLRVHKIYVERSKYTAGREPRRQVVVYVKQCCSHLTATLPAVVQSAALKVRVD